VMASKTSAWPRIQSSAEACRHAHRVVLRGGVRTGSTRSVGVVRMEIPPTSQRSDGAASACGGVHKDAAGGAKVGPVEDASRAPEGPSLSNDRAGLICIGGRRSSRPTRWSRPRPGPPDALGEGSQAFGIAADRVRKKQVHGTFMRESVAWKGA
jgi:hypothetical protein